MAQLLRFGNIRHFSQAVSKGRHESGGMDLWKKLSFFVAIPCVVLMTLKNILDAQAHPHERPEFIPWEHLRIRNKRFPWGDGKRSFFHNPKTNPLPDGYEE